MAKITLKDILNGQKTKGAKSYNTDLFNSDNENITDDFNASNYDFISLIDTVSTDRNLKETIIGTKDGEAYLINATSSQYNGDTQTVISQKWLTLQGFNYFAKEMFVDFDNDFIDSEGHLRVDIQDFYSQYLENQGYEINYQDILELGEYQSELDCTILSFSTDQDKHFITINNKGQLSRITKKPIDNKVGSSDNKPKETLKSILG